MSDKAVLVNGNGTHQVTRMDKIVVESFLARIKDPQLRMVAKQYLEMVNEVKAKQIDMGTATFVMGTYKELLNILALDNSKGKKVWGGVE